jgi:uncharacterized protein YlxW (UPF0749 family)
MLVTQFRTQSKVTKALKEDSAQDQATIISNLYDSNSELRKEVARLEDQMDQLKQARSSSDLDGMAEELNRLRILNGQSEVTGPGIQISIVAPLRAEDVMDLVNELRNAGAEAIAVNNQRIVSDSSFSNSGENVVIDGVEIKQPYVFTAIGSSDTLKTAIDRKGGLLTIITNSHPTAITTIDKREKLTLPIYKPGYQWKYAKVGS